MNINYLLIIGDTVKLINQINNPYQICIDIKTTPLN